MLSAHASDATTKLEGHGGPIMAATTTPRGDVLTGSFDNSVGMWSGAMAPPRWLEGHKAAVKAVIAIGNDLAASAGDDFSIILWDLGSGEPLHRLEGHQGTIADLTVDAAGTTLASAGWDRRIGLWDVATGAHKGWLEGHNGAVNAVAFVGDTLYSAGADGTIREWPDGKAGRAIVRHGFAVNEILADADAGWLAYGAVDGGTRAISLQDERELADLTLDRRPILALAAAGERLAVGDGEGHIMIVDTATWSIVHDYRATAKGPVWALAFLPDGKHLVAGGIDNAAVVLPVEGTVEPAMGLMARSFQRPPATMENGERQFQRKCSVCHVLTGDTARRAGPSLENLFGRPAGAIEGFRYSQTLTNSDIVWSEETLDALFDDGPDHYIPGSNMPMQRITGADDRRDLIEFLKTSTVE